MDEPIRIGIAGLGRAGWGMHCEELRNKEDRFRIVAVFDIMPSRREMAAERYGCRTYERIEDLILDSNVELVDIATRSIDHYDNALSALSKGKAVFLEKPMCLDYSQALHLKAVSTKVNGAKLFVRHNRRFDNDFLHIREIIDAGILGEVFEVKLTRHWYERRNDWQTLKSFGGGQLLNWGAHIIDQALCLLDSPVKQMFSDLKRIAAAGDAEDHVKLVLKGENNRTADIEISGGVAAESPLYMVFGTRGTLSLIGDIINIKYLDPEKRVEKIEANPEDQGLSYGIPEELPWVEKSFAVNPSLRYDIWDELYKAVRLGRGFPIKLDEVIQTMKIITDTKSGTEFA